MITTIIVPVGTEQGLEEKTKGRSALFFSRLVFLYFVNSKNNN
jgi:hypothetical protein